MRLRTLPLSLSGVMLGCMIASATSSPNWLVIALVLLTTALLQILSNVSNELGDTLSGTDSVERQGPAYSLSQGKLSIRDFKLMIAVYTGLCALSGTLMVYFSFGTLLCREAVLLLLLGAFAIRSAIKYTLGRNPYGYRGWGDIYVFLFFGLVSVVGGYFMVSHNLSPWTILLPAVSIGLFSVAVLNVNNIRDMKTDASTRLTTPLRLGARRARVYHTLLISCAWAVMLFFCMLSPFSTWLYLYVLTLPLFVVHLIGVWRLSDRRLDPMLPLLVFSTFLFSLLSGLGYLLAFR